MYSRYFSVNFSSSLITAGWCYSMCSSDPVLSHITALLCICSVCSLDCSSWGAQSWLCKKQGLYCSLEDRLFITSHGLVTSTANFRPAHRALKQTASLLAESHCTTGEGCRESRSEGSSASRIRAAPCRLTPSPHPISASDREIHTAGQHSSALVPSCDGCCCCNLPSAAPQVFKQRPELSEQRWAGPQALHHKQQLSHPSMWV